MAFFSFSNEFMTFLLLWSSLTRHTHIHIHSPWLCAKDMSTARFFCSKQTMKKRSELSNKNQLTFWIRDVWHKFSTSLWILENNCLHNLKFFFKVIVKILFCFCFHWFVCRSAVNSWRRFSWFMYTFQCTWMDWSSYCSQEAQAIFQIPNTWVGKGIPFQCLRFEAKALGTRKKLEFDRKTGKREFFFISFETTVEKSIYSLVS